MSASEAGFAGENGAVTVEWERTNRRAPTTDRRDTIPGPWHLAQRHSTATWCGRLVARITSSQREVLPAGTRPDGAVCDACVGAAERGHPIPVGKAGRRYR